MLGILKGNGLRHEEYDVVYEEVKFLQIWIERNCKILQCSISIDNEKCW